MNMGCLQNVSGGYPGERRTTGGNHFPSMNYLENEEFQIIE
jgi:hypothetical protein